MKKLTTALLALMGLAALDLQGQTVGHFDDIQFWTGSGTNRAALVLQWNDGGTPASLAWGYRWNGEATGADMLTAIAGSTIIRDLADEVVDTASGADPRIVLGVVRYPFGDAVQSITFAAEAGLRTQEDWFSGYWEYFVFGGTFEYYDWDAMDSAIYDVPGSPTHAAVTWLTSPVGAVDRPLSDGSWDALSFAPDFASQPVQIPQAAPLPVPALEIVLAHGRPEVGLASVAGLSYQLLFTDSLQVAFAPMGDAVVGQGGPMVFADDTVPRPPQRFYRIAVSP